MMAVIILQQETTKETSEKIALQTTQGSIIFDKVRNMFTVALTNIAWNRFKSGINNIQAMAALKDKYHKGFN